MLLDLKSFLSNLTFALRDLQSRSNILLLLATLFYASIKASQSTKRTSVSFDFA